MSLCPTPVTYRKVWAASKEPKLVHLTYLANEASLHPRVLHSNDSYSEVILLLSGGGEYFIGGQAYTVRPGDLVFFNAGVAHDQRTTPGEAQTSYGLAVTGFTNEGCRPNCLLPDDANPILSVGACLPSFENLFALLQEQLEKELPGYEHTVHYLTQAILAQIKELLNQRPDPTVNRDVDEIPLATRVRAYLDENFCEDMSLQALSERFNISSYYLAHIFKDQFGYPPLQYILRRRIGLAQTLLITTNLPVGEIGARVGYYNPSHFNLIFTKNVGISPRKYRLNYLN